MHLDGRTVGDLAAPEVQILSLARLEEQGVVAVVQLGELVQLVELALGVELGILAAVGHHVGQVAEEVAVSLARRRGERQQGISYMEDCANLEYDDDLQK